MKKFRTAIFFNEHIFKILPEDVCQTTSLVTKGIFDRTATYKFNSYNFKSYVYSGVMNILSKASPQ